MMTTHDLEQRVYH